MSKIINTLAKMRAYFGFFLTLVCILICGYVAIMKDTNVVTYLPMILGTYLGARAMEKSSHVWAASKDPTADTAEVIKSLNQNQ